VANAAGPVNQDGTFPNVRLNVVRGVSPGTPWRIADLKADIRTDGRIRIRGRGLLLASGNSIGQNGNASVFATLICEAAAPFVEHSTFVSVPLEAMATSASTALLTPCRSTAPPRCCSFGTPAACGSRPGFPGLRTTNN
jgi:hypothetical protein